MSDERDDRGETHHGHDHDHHHAHDAADVGVAVVTVSSTRSLDSDPSGDAIEGLLADATDAHLATRNLVPDERSLVREAVRAAVEDDGVDAVVTTGGTGITPDDVTVEAVAGLFEKRLPGFGETFRRESESQIGKRVVGTRATAGVVERVPVFCLPGSENAARLGVGEVILPVLAHLVGQARR
jgi:molybdenum cofactor biosynthesis protein B